MKHKIDKAVNEILKDFPQNETDACLYISCETNGDKSDFFFSGHGEINNMRHLIFGFMEYGKEERMTVLDAVLSVLNNDEYLRKEFVSFLKK
jgi:hypothetical protein